jgi:hypothetical protein
MGIWKESAALNQNYLKFELLLLSLVFLRAFVDIEVDS